MKITIETQDGENPRIQTSTAPDYTEDKNAGPAALSLPQVQPTAAPSVPAFNSAGAINAGAPPQRLIEAIEKVKALSAKASAPEASVDVNAGPGPKL